MSGRLIYADAVKDRIVNDLVVDGWERVRAVIDGECRYSDFMDAIISSLAIIDSTPDADKWIPCKERLPDKKGEYLCTIRYTTWNGKVDRGIFSGYYTKTNGWQIGEGIVIAWMPLPEPYKEQNDE